MEISQKLIEFVHEHSSEDVVSLRLKFSGKAGAKIDFDPDFALLQIEARQKIRRKLPGFLNHQDFIFPTLLSVEQASNEAVARFHASLVNSKSSLLDLTAGLGIDDLSFAMKGVNVTACELDEIKCDALRHNAAIFGLSDKLKVINGDSIDYISKNSFGFDVVYADPARRNVSGGRVHAFSDCQPDILSVMPDIMKHAPRMLVKSSPLLDLSLIRQSVNDLNHIYVVCFKGECKEVLVDIRKECKYSGVTVVDLDWDKEISRFDTSFNTSEKLPSSSYCDLKNASDYQFLYEPNAGIMKTGAWNSLIDRFPDLKKTDPNSHIFLSDTFYNGFPGRVMKISFQPDKKALKALKGEKINVVSRNHPLTAPQIIRKYALTPGSDRFLYAFRYCSVPIFLEVRAI